VFSPPAGSEMRITEREYETLATESHGFVSVGSGSPHFPRNSLFGTFEPKMMETGRRKVQCGLLIQTIEWRGFSLI